MSRSRLSRCSSERTRRASTRTSFLRKSTSRFAKVDKLLGCCFRVTTFRVDVGAIAALGGLVIGRLPKTRSGFVCLFVFSGWCPGLIGFLSPRKTLRRTIRGVVEACARGEYNIAPTYPPTIEDVAVVEQAQKTISGYFKSRASPKVQSKL